MQYNDNSKIKFDKKKITLIGSYHITGLKKPVFGKCYKRQNGDMWPTFVGLLSVIYVIFR